jgi:hypothetical protein
MTAQQQESMRKDKSQTMNQDPIPSFANEQEEAAWWDAHPEVLTGRLGAPNNKDPFAASAKPICLALQKLSSFAFPMKSLLARQLAAKRGLRYQTYLKRLLHEALDNEEKKLAS